MVNSNSFLSPCKILLIAQENKYSVKFYHEIVCCVYSVELPNWGKSNEYTQHTIIVKKIEKKFPKLSLFASWPGTMINLQWLELPISRSVFCGPKDVWAIEVRLYCGYSLEASCQSTPNEYPQYMFLWRNKKKYPYFWGDKKDLIRSCVSSIALVKAFFFFQSKSIDIFLISPQKHMLWVLIRNTSVRRF